MLKIDKVQGTIQYQLTFGSQNDVNAYVQPNGTNFIYGCGQDASNTNPVYWKVTSSGDMIFYRALTMVSDAICYGITYNSTM